MSRVPFDTLGLPSDFPAPDRLQVVRVHRPGQTPLRFGNLHVRPSLRNPTKGSAASAMVQILDASVRHLAVLGGDTALIGDMNFEPSEPAVFKYLLAGALRIGDSELEITEPTRVGGKRHIDYMLHSSSVYPLSRTSAVTSSDHKLIVYEVPSRATPLHRIWPKPCRLLSSMAVSPADWSEHFAPSKVAFTTALQQHDVCRAWQLLSSATCSYRASRECLPRWPSTQEAKECQGANLKSYML